MRFLGFLGTVLLFLFGMHFVVFRSVIYFFDITRPAARNLVYLLMLLLALSFVSAFFLLHWRANTWTICYYRSAATWTGLLIGFFVATIAVWLVLAVVGIAGIQVRPQAVAAVFFIAAGLWGIYGMWNAYHPVVRNLTIPIAHLPKAWEGRTIVQLSDVHLDYLFGTAFAEKVFQKADDLHPDLIVVTGDLFDGIDKDLKGFVAAINRLHARRGVLFVTGNHEYYIGIKRVMKVLKETKLRVLNNEMIDIDGLQIIGIGYPGIHSLSEIKNLPRPDTGEPARILLFHTPTNIGLKGGPGKDRHMSTYWKPDTSYTMNKELHLALQLSGHTHNGQVFPFNLVTHLLYNGHDYGLSRSGALRIYTTCGTGSWGPPMRTPIRPEIVRITLVSKDTEK